VPLSKHAHQTEADLPTEDLEDLYENAPCGYLSILPNGRIFKVNKTFLDWIGVSREQLVGRRLHDLLHVAGRIFFETHFAPLLRLQGFFNEVPLDLVTQQRGRLPVLVNAKEKRDAEGRPLFTRLTIFNATERRRYERQLVEAREVAEESAKEREALRVAEHAVLLDERAMSALREQFIAVLGHDLRNPLSGIMGGTHLLQKTPLNDRAKKIVSMMESSAARMAVLIDNVLDFARGRLSGGLALSRDANVLLEPLLRQVVAEMQMSRPDRVFELEFAIAEPVDCDPGRIGQLFSNLLGNASTHGAPDKPIRIEALTDDEKFQLTVSNAGEPIPTKAQERLFEPFFRADVRPSQQGLGLGLYIVSEIARAHDGTIDVSSNESETCFTFRMPRRARHGGGSGS
jgi:sigma-B regulation protein RsbU (phosphoserine phosphatase)